MRHLFLGQASNLRGRIAQFLFTIGKKKDETDLIDYLAEHYHTLSSRVFLTSSGRAAITLALESLNLKKHSGVIVNGFTCYAVVQAVKSAGFTPIYADIDEESLNFSPEKLEEILKSNKNISAVIIQNTLGNPCDIDRIRNLARDYNLRIIEDLAHCTGLRYPSGIEMGTVGDAACLSFGKSKSIDTTTGGALILSSRTSSDILDDSFTPISLPERPSRRQSFGNNLRAKVYPLLGSIGRFFTRIHLGKYYYGAMIRLRFITRAVDFPLDTTTRPFYWQDRLALDELKNLFRSPRPIRSFLLVNDREDLLDLLEKKGYHLRELWYDVPVAPVRYYRDLHFPEDSCPVATSVSRRIINIPEYYTREELKPLISLIKSHEKRTKNGK